jgi:hypothetical protein
MSRAPQAATMRLTNEGETNRRAGYAVGLRMQGVPTAQHARPVDPKPFHARKRSRPLSIDARLLVRVPGPAMVRALRRAMPKEQRRFASLWVRAVGPDASIVSTPFRAPLDVEEALELVTWARAHVASQHRDARGVLAFPDVLEVRARTYDGAVRAVGASGFWLSLRGKRSASESEASSTPSGWRSFGCSWTTTPSSRTTRSRHRASS